MKTGEIIGELARKKNINLRQLAIKADVPYNTLYAIVKRKSDRIDPGTLQRIADALGVHIFDLNGIGKELDKYVPKLEDISFPPDISPSEKERIIELLKSNPRILYNALSDEEKEEFWKIKRDYEADVDQVAQDYNNLDQWGKKAVRAVISAEQERMHGTEGKDTTTLPPPPESP